MPVVVVYIWSGVTEGTKRRVIAGITGVFEELGIPREAVEVIIVEVPKENWGVGGEPTSEKFKHVKPP